jgi:hypothetical protein
MIKGVKAQLAGFRIGQGHADAVALHHATDAGRNLTKQFPQVQL